VIVLDGDGALLMHLGTMVTVAAVSPPNLVHVVLDNGSYDSTGGQPTTSPKDWPALARAAGYRHTHSAADADELSVAMKRASDTQGPHFVVVTITRSGRGPAEHGLDGAGAVRLAEQFRAAL
jgi:phosphonopyruvate decarboxylase